MDDGTQDEGQVSEVASMDPDVADVPISDDQAVAGNPDDQSGEAQEGTAGPNALPRHNPPEEGNESSR
ncbi:hypothetical protein LRP67_18535 [Nocardioides sp. cx-169]|uniref:hypothetical protein n=1 Tax=Nocardioides sp. cx-169 TaxID=2899080 RepID=UPI001E2966E5|nr:hypothetical protein [Nocardioides sp. cx-169]MCD4536091.1 hypothetical protein [Nocardioides sp. cx-169]